MRIFARMLPLCSSMARRAMESPRPMPPLARSRRFPRDRRRRRGAAELLRERPARSRGRPQRRGRSRRRSETSHRGLARRIADGVANHVLDGAPQQLRVAFHSDRLARLVFDLASARGGFDAGIVHQLLHQFDPAGWGRDAAKSGRPRRASPAGAGPPAHSAGRIPSGCD